MSRLHQHRSDISNIYTWLSLWKWHRNKQKGCLPQQPGPYRPLSTPSARLNSFHRITREWCSNRYNCSSDQGRIYTVVYTQRFNGFGSQQELANLLSSHTHLTNIMHLKQFLYNWMVEGFNWYNVRNISSLCLYQYFGITFWPASEVCCMIQNYVCNSTKLLVIPMYFNSLSDSYYYPCVW